MTAEADRKLLLGDLKVHDMKVDYDSLAKYMATDEHTPTPLSISKRINKLKAIAKDGGNDDEKDEKTARKRTKSAMSTSRKRTATGRKADDAAEDEDIEEEGKATVKAEGKDDLGLDEDENDSN